MVENDILQSRDEVASYDHPTTISASALGRASPDLFAATIRTFTLWPEVLSGSETSFSGPDFGFFIPDNGLAVLKDTFGASDLTYSVSEDVLSALDLVLSVADLTLSEPDLTLSEAEKVTSGRPKGLFLSKNGVFYVPKPFLQASKPLGAIAWLFLDS